VLVEPLKHRFRMDLQLSTWAATGITVLSTNRSPAREAHCRLMRSLVTGDRHGFLVPTMGSTAPGPGAARTSLASRRSPHSEHTKTASEMWPQALWVT
jgi:hypothetical protein